MVTLKEARESRGIKQSAVADAIHVVRQTYANYENHPELMTIGQAKAACEFIKCDINEIFFGSGVSITNSPAEGSTPPTRVDEES